MATSKRSVPLLSDVTREALGITRAELAHAEARLASTPTLSGYAHAAYMAAPLTDEVRARIAAYEPAHHTTAQVGGISAAEPDPVDPEDLLTCTCGLTVHRASMASHLDAAARGVPWSTHLANLAARGGTPGE